MPPRSVAFSILPDRRNVTLSIVSIPLAHTPFD
jgi:hypothetical protein